MKKDIKDYLHLYMGCEVMGILYGEPRKGILTGVTNGGTECEIQFYEIDGFNVCEYPEFNETEEVRPILRPLSDMTLDEGQELDRFYLTQQDGEIDTVNTTYVTGIRTNTAKGMCYLLSKGFDLFGLIESGLAIDSTALPV